MIPPAHLFVIKMRVQNVLLHEKIIRESERERGSKSKRWKIRPLFSCCMFELRFLLHSQVILIVSPWVRLFGFP